MRSVQESNPKLIYHYISFRKIPNRRRVAPASSISNNFVVYLRLFATHTQFLRVRQDSNLRLRLFNSNMPSRCKTLPTELRTHVILGCSSNYHLTTAVILCCVVQIFAEKVQSITFVAPNLVLCLIFIRDESNHRNGGL